MQTYIRRTRALFLIICASLTLISCASPDKSADSKYAPKFTTEYQAVFMDNGQVFFGKLEQAGAEYPLLKEVFYVQNQANPETKEVKNTLVKRGQEWHAPDLMYINSKHILVIEPVTANSQLAQLVQQAKSTGNLTK